MPNQESLLWERLKPGLVVRTISGRNVGTVGIVGAHAFRLDDGDRSIWLRPDILFTIDEGQVSLICEEAGIERFVASAG